MTLCCNELVSVHRIITLSTLRYVVDAESLTIRDVTEADEGTYTCMMNTSLDQDSASAMLTVVGMLVLKRKKNRNGAVK